MSDEFYIGYEPRMPAGLASRVRLVAATALALCLIVAGLLLLAQSRFGPGVFEFGQVRSFEGRISAQPAPILEVGRPDETGPAAGASHYLLVAPGKFGAADLVEGFDSRLVRLSGTLIAREGAAMIEIVPGTIQPAGASASPVGQADLERLGPDTVDGEIVDSKCYLGVMKPGDRQTHRDCAVRCISGGIPPMLVARDASRRPNRLLLVPADGATLGAALQPYIAKPVSVRGTLLKRGDAWFLATSTEGMEAR